MRRVDLGERQDLGCAADWVLALEVLEHVPRENELEALANVHRHNAAGVVVSWARPGQGGFGHKNERPGAWVRALFAEWGYKADRAAEDKLRRSTSLAHFKRTMVFRQRKRAPAAAARRQHATAAAAANTNPAKDLKAFLEQFGKST